MRPGGFFLAWAKCDNGSFAGLNDNPRQMTSQTRHPTRRATVQLATHAALAFALTCVLGLPSHAAPIPLSVSERLPLVQTRANFLRESLRKPGLSPARVEADYAAALKKAEQHWHAGHGDDALLALSPLQKYAPIAELPFIKAQLLMAAIAEDRRDTELRNHHRAFATALVQSIGASGNGLSQATALRLVLPSEAEGWLLAQRERYQTLGKDNKPLQSGARRYDRWQVRQTDGSERTLYFEVPTATRARTVRPTTAPASAAK